MAPDIVQDLKLGPQSLDKEDIAVDSHGLISERDTMAAEAVFPHDVMTLTNVSHLRAPQQHHLVPRRSRRCNYILSLPTE